MFFNFFLKLLGNATAIFVANRLLDNFAFNAPGETLSFQFVAAYLFASLVLTILNSAIKPFLKLLLTPFIILTLGLLSIAINMFLLKVLDWIMEPLSIDGLLALLYASFIIGMVNFLFSFLKK
jgi:putative membrane protein